MSRCPPASGTPFITQPRAKKKPRGPTEESRPKQNLLVYPRTPPHRQVDAILPAASSTLERASELIDAKLDFAHFWHSGCGAKPLKMLISMGWYKTFLHVQALDSS